MTKRDKVRDALASESAVKERESAGKCCDKCLENFFHTGEHQHRKGFKLGYDKGQLEHERAMAEKLVAAINSIKETLEESISHNQFKEQDLKIHKSMAELHNFLINKSMSACNKALADYKGEMGE